MLTPTLRVPAQHRAWTGTPRRAITLQHRLGGSPERGLPGTQWQQAQWPLGSLCPRLSSGGALRLQCGDSLSLHPCHALLGPPAGGGAGEKTALEEGKKKRLINVTFFLAAASFAALPRKTLITTLRPSGCRLSLPGLIELPALHKVLGIAFAALSNGS